MKRFLALMLTGVLLVISLTGCGSGDQTSTSASTDKGGSSESSSGTVDGTTNGKDSVTIATTLEPSVFFMQHSELGTTASFTKDCTVLYNIYDMLFVINDEGEFTPRLGVDYTVSDDGLEYVVEIRDDAYFSNGDKVTAEDVAFSANLCAETVPPNMKGMFTNFASAEVVDETHVKYILSAPFAAFPNCWTSRCVPIIDQSYFEEVGEDGYQENPVGSGPYILDKRVSGEYLVLKANDNYWGGAPEIKTVTIKIITNISTEFISLNSGEVDVILAADMASCLQLDGVNYSYTTHDSATRAFAMINTNTNHGSVLTDLNLRKAIASCVNRDDLIVGVCEGSGSAAWVDMPLSYTGMPALETMTQALPYDLDTAKEYLEASDYDGSAIQIMAVSGTRQEKAANILQGALISAGINAEVAAIDSATNSGAMQSGEWDIMIVESTGSLYDSSCLNNIYTSASFAQWQDDEQFNWLKGKIDIQMVNIDAEERAAQTGEILSYLNENVISVPLYNPVSSVAYDVDLKGVNAHPQSYVFLNEWHW